MATSNQPHVTPEPSSPPAPESGQNSSHASFVGSIPDAYDTHLGPLLFEFSAADLARRIAAAAPEARQVLEIACGTGISTEHLWRSLNAETKITATDLNDAMLDHARERRGSLSNVTYAQADAQDLPYDDHSFDVVVCQFGIMFFPEKAQAMAEFARVLRPGGVLAFNVWNSLAQNPVVELAHSTIAGFFADNPPDFLTIPFGYYEKAPILQLLSDAGFVDPDMALVADVIERPDAVSVARGLVEGNPGIIQIRERASADPDEIVATLAKAIESAFGPAPLKIPLEEFAFLAQKP